MKFIVGLLKQSTEAIEIPHVDAPAARPARDLAWNRGYKNASSQIQIVHRIIYVLP
jgi:hypothetical protein